MQMRTRLFRAFGYRSCLQSANRRPSLRRLRAVRVAMPRLLFRHDGCWNAAGRLVEDGPPYERSEEHTSETPVTNAQLVCRLLLEKKNTYTIKTINQYIHQTPQDTH